MINLEDELTQDYLAECRDRLASVESDLLAMEKGGPEKGPELIDRAFQTIHWLKGAAGLFDLLKIRELGQHLENVLGLIRSHKLAPTPDQVRVLLHAIDKLQELIQAPEANNRIDTAGPVIALLGMCATHGTGHVHQPRALLRALLAEDDFASRLLLQTFLSGFGECHVAVNGREAVDAVRAGLEHGQRYDLICMDIMMPEMDGREAVRQIRALEEEFGILSTSGVKIVMTTAVDEVKEVVRCFHELCDSYLTKPVDLAQLLGLMKSFQLA
jgi:two-component system, chemotaxis family, chemotaxis protein CheY